LYEYRSGSINAVFIHGTSWVHVSTRPFFFCAHLESSVIENANSVSMAVRKSRTPEEQQQQPLLFLAPNLMTSSPGLSDDFGHFVNLPLRTSKGTEL
jgi:hypothetical protein